MSESLLRGQRGVSRSAEASMTRRDGRELPAKVTATALTDEAGVVNGIILTVMELAKGKQAEERAQQETFRMETLTRAAERLNAQAGLASVLKVICEEAAYALNVPAAGVYLYEDGRKELHLAEAISRPETVRLNWPPIPRSAFDQARAQMGDIVVIPDLRSAAAPFDLAWPTAGNVRTLCLVGLVRAGQFVGTLNLWTYDEPRRFASSELTLLNHLAAQAAQAIVTARAFQDVHRHLEHVQALHHIDAAIIGASGLNARLSVVLEQAAAQLHVEAADIFLFNTSTAAMHCAAVRGPRLERRLGTTMSIWQGLIGQVALSERAIVIPDLADQPTDDAQWLLSQGYRAYGGVPLMVGGQLMGVLEVMHGAVLTTDAQWLNFFETLARQAAAAIDNAQRLDGLKRSNLELARACDAIVESWARAVDLRDKETEGHSQRVTELTLRLARALGVRDSDLVHIRRGALLHDVGKMGLPDSILLKPGPLDSDEWVLMRKHPEYARQFLEPVEFLRPAIEIPYCHHERWDGSGYPRGLKEDAIPLAARIFAVADIWDALQSDRPYRRGWPTDKVREYIYSLSGYHLDPRVVRFFLELTAPDD
jgi:putative nucleotidyltransferase with HDIG domain